MAMGFGAQLHRTGSILSGSLCVFLAVWICGAASAAVEGKRPPRIFLLEGLSATEAWVQGASEAFTRRLKERSSEDVEIYSDFLDLGRFGGRANEDRLVKFLDAKFAQVRPDIIVPISRSAVDFLVQHQREFA